MTNAIRITGDGMSEIMRPGCPCRNRTRKEKRMEMLTNGNTLIIDVANEDFDKIKRVIVGCGPMCRTFYEEGGEAHWIKSYTPDDGEIYECDNCGVTWQFNEGGPEENEAFYCPKCGFKMGRGEADGRN